MTLKMDAAGESEEVFMTLANVPMGPGKYPSKKTKRLGGDPHHGTVRQFTISKWWHTPISSAGFMAYCLLSLVAITIVLGSFPWDDSTFVQKLMMLLVVSPHSFACILTFVLSFTTWADPYKLILDGKGGLILRSMVRARRIAIEDIKAVVLARQQNGEESADAPDICTKLSRGKLKLSRFAAREEFLNALKAVHPALVVETD